MLKVINEYIKYWTSPAPTPRSIRWLEKLTWGVSWRPVDQDAFLVSHQAMGDESKNYERLIPEYDPNKHITNLDEKELERATKNEIRNRVFKSIYLGNLYDDLMPIEARYYSTTAQRKAKLAVMVALLCAIYSACFFLPSMFYGTWSNDRSLYATSKADMASYVEGGLAAKFIEMVSEAHVQLPTLKIDKNLEVLPQILAYRAEVDQVVQSEISDISRLDEGGLWAAAPTDTRRHAVSDAVFLHGLATNKSAFKIFNDKYKLVVAPANNLLELSTQLVLLSWTVILLSWFLSKKSQFYEVFESLDSRWRIAAIISLEETLSSNFYYRKKFHYLLAGCAALVATLIHYVTIDRSFAATSAPAAAILNLEPIDYRISSVAGPIVVMNWALQFLVGYTLVLVCWELRLLHECMRIWQAKILRVGMLGQNEFDRLFSRMSKSQWADWAILGAVIILTLTVLSILKVFLQPVLPADQLALLTQGGLGENFASRASFWSIWSLIYTFMPVILALALMWLVGTTSAPSHSSVTLFQKKKLGDIDAAIDYLIERAKKIEALKTVWDQLASLYPSAEPDTIQTLADAPEAKDKDGKEDHR